MRQSGGALPGAPPAIAETGFACNNRMTLVMETRAAAP